MESSLHFTRNASKFERAAPPRTPSPDRGCENGEWKTPTRTRVIALARDHQTRKKRGLTTPYRSLNEIYKHAGVPPRTGRYWIKSESMRRTGSQRTGRPRLITEDMLDDVESWIEDNGYPGRSAHWDEIRDILDLPGHWMTLRKACATRDLRKFKARQKKWLTPTHIQQRLAFAKAHRAWTVEKDWSKVRFTDETHVALGSKNMEWVIRRHGERDMGPEVTQHKEKRKDSYFHCWAMVGFNFKSELVIYGRGSKGGNLTMESYINKILVPLILPAHETAQNEGRGFILEEDNDGSHGTKSVNNKVTPYKKAFEHYANPPNSPDFSPIENVWRMLKQRVKCHKAVNLIELEAALQFEWKKLSLRHINKLISTMPLRMEEAIEHGGMQTRY